MKKASLFVLIIGLFLAFACEKAEDNYAFYRATDSTNFKTNLGGELYLFGFQDEAFEIADYYLGVKSSITTYGEDIERTGFVWSPTNSDPRIGAANTKDTTIEFTGTDDTLALYHRIRNLTDDTEYYVRSFVFTDKDTGYNQHVTKLKTHPALDEWREMTGATNKPTGRRYDAFAFNIGDTVIFGTGNEGGGQPSSDLKIFIPNQGWSDLGDGMPLNTDYNEKGTSGAIGFGLRFKKNQQGPAVYTTRFFVGLGDYSGTNEEKSNILYEYNFDQVGGAGFTGNKITYKAKVSHAVCFIIGENVYIGTGMGVFLPTKSWYVFHPAYAVDTDPLTEAFEGLDENPNDGLGTQVGRYGAVATAVNGRGYFGLGIATPETGASLFLDDWHRYNPGTTPTNGTWEKRAKFIGDPRAHAVIFVIGDQIYVGGGDQVALSINIPAIEDPSFVGDQPIFNDFYRYDPFNDKWTKIRDYTQDKADRSDEIRKVTRAVAYSNQAEGVGYVGSGIDPLDVNDKMQEDFWKYLPYRTDVK